MLTLYQSKVKGTAMKQNSQKTLKGFASFSPAVNNSNYKLKAGYYFFVQFKNTTKDIYLLPMISYISAHSFLTSQVLKLKKGLLKESDLLSAGEIIIGTEGQVVAWCLKSGAYWEKLALDSPKLVKETFLPKESFYSINVWESFSMQNYFELYFDKAGALKPEKTPIISIKNIVEYLDDKLSKINLTVYDVKLAKIMVN